MTDVYRFSTYYLGPDENSLIFNATRRKNPFSTQLSPEKSQKKQDNGKHTTIKKVSGKYCDFIKKDEHSIFNIVQKKVKRIYPTLNLPKIQEDKYEDTYIYFCKTYDFF